VQQYGRPNALLDIDFFFDFAPVSRYYTTADTDANTNADLYQWEQCGNLLYNYL
jgi:hypothetical protein